MVRKFLEGIIQMRILKFTADDGGTNYDGYNWVLYQSGLDSGFAGNNEMRI